MSRIGKTPVLIPKEVQIVFSGDSVTVTGPKGQITMRIPGEITCSQKDGEITIETLKKDNYSQALHGSIQALLVNMIHGVTEGWSKTLELVGVGYRAEVTGTNLVLTVGFSHPVVIKADPTISFAVEENIVTVSGADKALVGNVAAEVRAVRPPEPYKGKGIKYQGERIRRKVGKAAKAVGAAGAK